MSVRLPVLIVSLLVVVCCLHGNGQAPKIRYGKVSVEELKNNIYPLDTAAAAVILFDKGHFTERDFKFTRHIRIKILKNAGTFWGDWRINVPFKSDIRATTYNLQDETIQEDHLRNSSIFEEQIIDRFYVYKFFLPNVKVGSIIEIKYSHPGLPFEWRFQERIPVVYNELILEKSVYINFSKIQMGFEPIHAESDIKWFVKDMPAFNVEPHLNDYGNYVTKFLFQLASVGWPGLHSEISTSWRNVCNVLLDYQWFGGILESTAFLNDKAKEIRESGKSEQEKIGMAYDYIYDNIKWNKQFSAFCTIDYRANFKTNHSGNSAEINLLLVALLNKIGIKAYPVVLSTRDNGLLIRHFPAIDRINYVVAFVRYGDADLLLDATSEHLVPGVLPEYCLNGEGLIVMRDSEVWINLNRSYTIQKSQFINIQINDDGTTSASVSQKFGQYEFLTWMEHHDIKTKYDQEKAISLYRKKHPQLHIVRYEVSEIDKKNLSVTESMEVDLDDHVLDIGNEMLFSPFILSDYLENPFKSESRKYPVDLGAPSGYSSLVAIRLPERFTVKSLPESIRLVGLDGAISFTLLADSQASLIQLKATVMIKKPVFSEGEYQELRLFFSEVIRKLNEPVEISKQAN